MRATRVFSLSLLAVAASCSHSGTSAPPKTAPTPAAAPPAAAPPVSAPPAAAPPVAGAGGRAGAPGSGAPGTPGAGGRAVLTPEQRAARRDSIDKVRGATVAQLMTTIAGKEDQPAGQVFKNVQLLKDMPAKAFLTYMDSTVGRAGNWNCTQCHVVTDYAEDNRNGNPITAKARTRIMIAMVSAINSDHLTKLPAGRGGSPTVSCITCHRGVGGNPGRAIITPLP